MSPAIACPVPVLLRVRSFARRRSHSHVKTQRPPISSKGSRRPPMPANISTKSNSAVGSLNNPIGDESLQRRVLTYGFGFCSPVSHRRIIVRMSTPRDCAISRQGSVLAGRRRVHRRTISFSNLQHDENSARSKSGHFARRRSVRSSPGHIPFPTTFGAYGVNSVHPPPHPFPILRRRAAPASSAPAGDRWP